jgi:hypothetical protein
MIRHQNLKSPINKLAALASPMDEAVKNNRTSTAKAMAATDNSPASKVQAINSARAKTSQAPLLMKTASNKASKAARRVSKANRQATRISVAINPEIKPVAAGDRITSEAIEPAATAAAEIASAGWKRFSVTAAEFAAPAGRLPAKISASGPTACAMWRTCSTIRN